ncbi:MAG: glycosyltransferase [Myxococcales bacterium]
MAKGTGKRGNSGSAAHPQAESISESPLVSVVIPSYNHRRFIGKAVDSVLQQSHQNVELIVIDDGSSDGSAELLREAYGSDPRVQLRARENRGAHATLNEAVGLARGEFVTILNSDDLYLPTRLERLVQAARQHGGHPFFGITGVRIVDERDEPLPVSGPTRYYASVLDKFEGRPAAAAFWVGNLAMTTSNFFFSRGLLEKVGTFAPLRYTHDWDWALRASEVVSPVRLDDVLLCYRVHGTNTIAEGNMWKHVSENAYVFASAIKRAGIERMAERAGVSPHEVMQAMLANESFGPVPTLFLLGLGKSPEELTQLLERGALEEMLPKLVGRSRVDTDLMLSAEHLRHKLGDKPAHASPKPAAKKAKPKGPLTALRAAGKRVRKSLRSALSEKRK